MLRSGSLCIVAAVAFWAGLGSANAVDQTAAGSSGDAVKPVLGTLTIESKCQILVDAMRDHDQTVINEGANVIFLSVFEHSDVITKQFGEKGAQQLLERSFNGCLSHPNETISSQAQASFQSILQALGQPGSRNEPVKGR